MRIWRAIAGGVLAVLAGGGSAAAQGGDQLAERVQALRTSLERSQAALHGYEWIETTVVSVGGEERSRRQMRCYWGADGRVQKLPLSATPPGDGPRGLRGRIAERRKEEIEETIERAIAQVHRYVPPEPARLEARYAAGLSSIQVLDPGRRVRVDFRDYLRSGDRLGIEIAVDDDRLLGIEVATYLESPSQAVTLVVAMGRLADGTTYAERATLDAPEERLRVVVENSGYR